ncbi:tetratricopeptide repeat protein [Actinoplanes sp. NPDC051851]|uniref:tetratricopeptide repeat protein n=1 Tax=Actinoplanes sp. NPDC051851 TaxID=3154753 RepID=UPI00343B3003
MKTADELWELIGEAQHLPYGSAQIALVEQVLRHVDAAGDPALAFTARLFATNAYIYGGESVKAFSTFSWCVADFDRNPQPYHERRMHSLLWLFKTMVSALTNFPEIPLARTRSVLDDMERRYREAGHGMQPVYKHRYLVAKHVGQLEEADAWFEKWQAAPRDSLSDCAGCDPTTLTEHLNARARYADAVELAEPVLAGELSCNEQPQAILSELMVSYLRMGRLREAADAHRRSYLGERGNLADLWGIGYHIQFCARTGNEPRGLEILQRHIDWLDRAPSPAAGMNFAASAVLLLRRLGELGHGDTVVRRAGHPDATATALAEELTGYATELAARFDARNGTDHQSRTVATVMAAEPYGVELPLSPIARRVTAPVPAPAPAVEPEPAPEIPSGASPAELIALAERHWEADRHEAARVTLAAVAPPDDAALAARYLTLLGRTLPDDDHEGTIAAWERAIELFTEVGEVGRASVLAARIALEEAEESEDGAGEEGLAVVLKDVAHQDEHGDASDRASAWLRVSTMYLMLGRVEEANEAGDRADEIAGEIGEARRLAYHAMIRARNRATAQRHEDALAAARFAWDFYREHGPAAVSASAAAVFGQISDDPAEVVTALGETLAAGATGPALMARVRRGRALMQLERAEEAIDDLVEAVALCAENGLDEGGVFARQDLGQAYRAAGRPAEAAEVGEEALLGFERLGYPEPANDTRLQLAGAYRDLGDSGRALELYRELIERLADNPAGRGQIGELAGQALYDLDRDSEAALTFRAAAEALRESGDPVGELRVLRRRLMALNYADEVPAAEELIAQVAAKYADLAPDLAAAPGVIWGRAIFAFETGNLLMRRDRYAEAVEHLLGAPEQLREIGAGDDADRVEAMLNEARDAVDRLNDR